MKTIMLTEMREAAKRLFKNLKLIYILRTLRPGENVQHLLLSEEEKSDLTITIRLANEYVKEFEDIANSVTPSDMATMSVTANDRLDQILQDETLSLRQKVLNIQSKDCMPFIRVWEVPGILPPNKHPKNILFLNKKPDCYVFNDEIANLLQNLHGLGYSESIVISTTAMDARIVLETWQIDGIYNCDESSFGPRHAENLLNAFNTEALEGKKFNDVTFNNHVMALPINNNHRDLSAFVEELRKGKKIKQFELAFKM